MKLNIGCGEFKFDDFVNIDMSEMVNPDLILDIRTQELPYPEGSIETIFCSHNLEHIELKYWPHVFTQFYNVLIPNGRLVLVYPEFEKCAKYFLENYRGDRDFWRVALYGRQAYPGDYHVVPVVTQHLIQYLQCMGFKDMVSGPESPNQDYATMLTCVKGIRFTREDAFRYELFNEVKK